MSTHLPALTSLIYALLVLMWGLILVLYVFNLYRTRINNKMLSMLLIILAIDAFRSLFESAYFGLYFSKSFTDLTANIITLQPSYLLIPKLVNLATAMLIIFLLIRHWIPRFIKNESNIKNRLNAYELRLNATVKHSPNPILIHAEDGEVLSFSDKLLELTGYASEDLKTIRNWANNAYKNNAEEMYQKIMQSYENDNGYELEQVLVCAKNDKELIWDITSISLGKLEDGRKVRMVTATDVTDKIALLNRLYLIEHSINNVTESVLWFSEQGNIVDHNNHAEKIFGYSAVEFDELNINSLKLEIKTSWHDLWQRLSISNNIRFNSYLTTKDGEIIPITIFANYLEFNNLHYIFMIIHDISAHVLAEKAILESEQRRLFALEAANIGDWDMDLQLNIARRSPIHDACFGYETPVSDWGYDTFLSHVHPMDLKRVDGGYKKAMSIDGLYDVEFRVIWPDNSIHWLWSKGRFYFNERANPIRVSGIVVDITQKKHEEIALRLNKSAVEAATVGIVIVDVLQLDLPIVYVNPVFEKITGYNQSEVLGKNCRFLNRYDRDEETLSKLRAAIDARKSIQIELLNARKDGSKFWNHLNISPVLNDAGNVTHLVGIQMDVTARKKAEANHEALNARIKHLAYYDALTELPNRELLSEYLQEFVDSSDTAKTAHAIFLMDVDNFKNINDTFGHYVGDLFIKEFATRLGTFLDNGCFICRFGGDEFIFVMTDKGENAEKLFERAKNTGNKILTTMRLVFKLNGLELFSSVSMGLKFVNFDLDIINTIKQADLAMNQAKKLGKNNIQIFDDEVEKTFLYNAKLETYLRNALDNNEFELYYQPQIHSDNKVIGCEALIRWQSSDLGDYISPADFIPIAEETSLILPIGDWVLESGCKILNRWHQVEDFKDITLSVNISAVQFKNSNFVSLLEKILSNYTFNRANLKLELTETMIAGDVELVVSTMNKIKKMGLKISLDDFGTGYSSLSYLKAFPINQLKIDQSFVKDILIDPNDTLIAEAIIKLSETLGLETIAEGVETEAQRDCLIKLGCNQFQGYLYSKALRLGDVEKYIKQFNMKEVEILD